MIHIDIERVSKEEYGRADGGFERWLGAKRDLEVFREGTPYDPFGEFAADTELGSAISGITSLFRTGRTVRIPRPEADIQR